MKKEYISVIQRKTVENRAFITTNVKLSKNKVKHKLQFQISSDFSCVEN